MLKGLMWISDSEYFYALEWWRVLLIGALLASATMIGLACLVGLNLSNFVLVGGLLELAGAYVLALPDLKLYRRWFYAGQLKEAQRKFDLVLNDGQYIRNTDRNYWYDSLYEFLEKNRVLLPRDLPERQNDSDKDPWFGPMLVGSSKHFATRSYEGETGSISYQDFIRELQSEINSYDASIRRDGLTLLALGFLIQIIGSILALVGAFSNGG